MQDIDAKTNEALLKAESQTGAGEVVDVVTRRCEKASETGKVRTPLGEDRESNEVASKGGKLDCNTVRRQVDFQRIHSVR